MKRVEGKDAFSDLIHIDCPVEPTLACGFCSPREKPELYPGTRPNWSFCFTGDAVLPIRVKDREIEVMVELHTWTGLEAFVSDVTHSGLEDRFAILAVGSNACPARLSDDDKYGGLDGTAIPVLRGWISDVASVYNAHTASYGSVPATVMGVKGVQSRLWVTLLTEKELLRMDISEGRGTRYELVALKDASIVVEGQISIDPVSAYHDPHALRGPGAGGPLLLSCFDVTGCELSAQSQTEVQATLAMVTGHDGERDKELLRCRRERLPDNAIVLKPGELPSKANIRNFRGHDTQF